MAEVKPLLLRLSRRIAGICASVIRIFSRWRRRLLRWGGLKLKLISAITVVVLLSVITLNHFLVDLMEKSIREKAFEVGDMAIGRVADASFNAIVERTYENRVNLQEMLREASNDRSSHILDISIYALDKQDGDYVFSYFAGFKHSAEGLEDDDLKDWLLGSQSKDTQRLPATFQYRSDDAEEPVTKDAYRFVRPVIFTANNRSHVVGAVVLYYDSEAIAGPVRQAGNISTLTTLLILFPAIALAWWLSQRLSQPILKVSDAARRVADKDLDVSLNIRTADQIEFLAREFNRMVTGLREHEHMQKFVSGSTLDQIRRQSAGMSLGGSKRLQTILFSDIRGFTAMSEHREPLEVIEVVNFYLNLQTEIIRRHGGDIDKFIGDEIMSVFEGEDAVLRALQAAIEIQQAIAGHNQSRADDGRITLRTGIGINQGEVVAGNMGSADRMDFTSVGATVNLAARLCSHAQGGEILVPESVYLTAGEDFGAVPAEALTIKGFTQPVPVVALTCAS